MIYTYLINKALRLSYQAHQGQLDKAKIPYVFHSYYLAEQMGKDEEAICVALLHDVVEDSYLTIQDLELENFPQSVIEAVDVLTHKREDTYFDYIRKIKANSLATKVKIADINHNLDLTRFDWEDISSQSMERIKRYYRALSYLTSRRKSL